MTLLVLADFMVTVFICWLRFSFGLWCVLVLDFVCWCLF